MSLDVIGMADAIAARFASGTLAVPAGSPVLQPIRLATADLPSIAGSVLPALFVIPEQGSLDVGGGDRVGSHTWRALFLFAKTEDYPREVRAVSRWLTRLLDALLTSNQLAGSFAGVLAEVRIDGYSVGQIDYPGGPFTGAELVVHLDTTEAWSPTA